MNGQWMAWSRFLSITLQQIKFSVFISALMSFLTSFDEVITVLREFTDLTIAAISTIMILVSTTLLWATQFLG